MKSLKIVLLGSIPKGDEKRKNWVDWKVDYKSKIVELLPNAEVLDGDSISDNVGPDLVVGHDLWLVKQSNIVIVDGSKKIGAGTAQEMVIAKYFKKLVISVIPKESHHRKSNLIFHGIKIKEWIHPFLSVTSDYIADNIDDAINYIIELPKTKKVKGFDIFDKKISLYKKTLVQKGAKRF
jgi:hypothetical protein